MTRRVQENQAEYVEIPHAIHTSQESTGVLERGAQVLVPLVGALRHLPDDEADDCEGGGHQGGQH